MADLLVDGDDLVLRLRGREKMVAFHGDVRASLSSVQSVRVLDDPWLDMRGWRMAGVAIPRAFAFGTRRHGTGYDFTVVRGTGPGVQVELSHGRFQRLVVSSSDPGSLAASVAGAAGIRVSEPG